MHFTAAAQPQLRAQQRGQLLRPEQRREQQQELLRLHPLVLITAATKASAQVGERMVTVALTVGHRWNTIARKRVASARADR